jgi:hypothetical protein
MNFEERVLKYISKRDSSPLIFSKSYYSIIEIGETPKDIYNIDELINFVTYNSFSSSSWNLNKKVGETSSNRWRSSLDIWRHIKYYNDSYDIFDVMKALSNPNNFPFLSGHFCPDVKRRVFKNRMRTGHDMYPGNNDEYGVSLIYWINHFWPGNKNWFVDDYYKQIYVRYH